MKYYLFTLFLFFMMNLNAQEISSHLWKNRIVLVIADDISSREFDNQLKELKEDPKGMEERKLIIYQITSGKYKIGLNENKKWVYDPTLFEKFKAENENFSVVLIGLDGGVKLHKTEPISTGTLFGAIDQMPMRRSELRKNGNK